MLLSMTRELVLFVLVAAWYASHVLREITRDVHDACAVALKSWESMPYAEEYEVRKTLRHYRVLFNVASTATAVFACGALVSLVLNVVRICKVL